jgi:type IV pilus assembly protein PilC
MENENINYYYKAQDSAGEIHTGSIEASSKNSALSKIRAMNLIALEVSEKDLSGLNFEINMPFGKRVKLKDLAIATRQLSSMISSGLPLIRALSAVEEQTKNKKLKEAFRAVSSDVESGKSLSDSLEKWGDIFPPLMIGMIRVGESGGFLETSLESLADNFDNDIELRSKIRSSMAYPIVVSALAFVGVNIILIFIVPIFADMFASMDAQLPALTQFMMTLSKLEPILLPAAIVLIILYITLWPKYKNRPAIKNCLDPIKLKLPVIGKIYHKILVSRFASNLSTMLSAGVPLIQALSIVGQTADNVVLEKSIDKLADEVKKGKPIAKPISQDPFFPPILAQMVSVGEESGSIETMFTNVAKFYDREVKTTTDQLTSLIEPLLIVFVGIIIGGMVIGLYLPMFGLTTAMNNQINS